jgi:hypothetical protein
MRPGQRSVVIKKDEDKLRHCDVENAHLPAYDHVAEKWAELNSAERLGEPIKIADRPLNNDYNHNISKNSNEDP